MTNPTSTPYVSSDHTAVPPAGGRATGAACSPPAGGRATGAACSASAAPHPTGAPLDMARRPTRRRLRTMLFASLAVVLAVGLAACKTVPSPEEIPEGLTQAEIFQRAQEAVDDGNWEAALVYYETFLDRYPGDFANRAAAKYEVAFIYYRRGDLAAAEELFEELLADYGDPALQEQLPQWPRILAEKLLAKIEEKQREAVEETTETDSESDG